MEHACCMCVVLGFCFFFQWAVTRLEHDYQDP